MPDYNAIQKLDQQVQQQAPAPNVNNLYPTLSTSQIESDGRYPVYNFGLDNEDIYGRQQSGGAQLFNGLLKGLATTGTTAIGGTVGLINGVYQWAADGKFSSFYDNDMTRSIDNISQHLENTLPNYQTQEQRDRSWYNPKTYLTANFWGDNILKNAGFAAGSLISGLAWGKVGSMVGSLAKGMATGAIAEVGANSALESALLARDPGAIEQLGASSAKLANSINTFDKVKDVGQNLVRAGLSTFGESSMEAYQAKNTYKDTLTKEYQDKFGASPIGDALDKINAEADKVGNFTMGANIALLTATNYIQFPKILGSIWTGEKIAARSGIGALELVDETGNLVKRGTADAFKQGVRYQAATESLGKKILKTAVAGASTIFAPSEAFEEAAQYVIPISAQDYFNKGRTGQAQSVTESLGKGVKDLLTQKDGMMALITGGISGGLMQHFNPFHRENFLGPIRDLGREKAATNQFAQVLNGSMAGSGYMNEAIKSLNRAESLSTDAEVALRNNNRLQYEDTKTDANLNYMLPRIQYGRSDLIKDDLSGMRNVASSEAGYAELIKNGVVSDTVEREDFIKNIDKLLVLNDTTTANYKALYSKYANITEAGPDGKPQLKYNEDTIGKMAYIGAKIDDYNTRIPQLLRVFNSTDIDITGLMGSVHSEGIQEEGGTTKEKFNQVLDQIDSIQGISPELKDEMRTNAADLVELSARREFKIREYEQIKNNPSEWQDPLEQFSLAQPGEPDMSKINFNQVEPEETPGDYKTIFNLVSAQSEGKTPLETELQLREKYPKLYEQLTGTVEASKFEVQKEQAAQEGWYQDSNGNPVAPTSKSNFYDANQGDYSMRVNGTDREGTLGYDPDTNSLFFQYEDNGTPKQVEVFNEDFNDGTISKDSTVIDTGYLSEEDLSAPNRVQVRIGNLINDISQRQKQVQDQIDRHLKELNDIVEEIKTQDKSAAEFTKDYVETMSTLRDMQRETEDSYTALVQEREDLNNAKTELENLLANTPNSLKSSVDLIQQQQADLESLAAQNGLIIPEMQKLANSAKGILTRLGKKLISRMSSMAGIPASPNIQRVRQAFDTWNQTKSDEDLRTAITALSQEYQAIQNFEVKPLPEADVKYLNEQVAQMQEALKNIDARVKAKDSISKRLQELQKQTLEREEIVRETPPQPVSEYPESLPSDAKTKSDLESLKKEESDFLDKRKEELLFEGKNVEEAETQSKNEWDDSQEGKRSKELQTIVSTPEVFGDDSERTPISRYFKSTVLLPKSMRNKEYDQRLNIFLNKIGIFDINRRPNLRLVTITRSNEESLGLKGFIDKYFKVQDSFDKASNTTVSNNNPVDAPIGMVMAEMVNGNITFIDEAGNRLSAETPNLVDKVLLTKMKAASLTWSTGEVAYSDPTSLGEQYANSQREEFEQQRKSILESDKPSLFTFVTSQGRQRESSSTESPNLVGTLITEDVMKQKSPVIEVIRPDAGKNTKVVPGLSEGETVQVKSGTILLRTQDTLQKLNTRKLSKTERGLVKDALMYIVKNRETPSETLHKVRAFLEGSTFLKFGSNLETVTINKGKINLTEDAVNGTPFTQIVSTVGLDNLLDNQNTNVREGLIKSNKVFSEFTGIKDGEPQFKDWNTYQEFVLSNEDGRIPLVYAPIMVDKYLVFSPEKAAADVVIKPKASPEVTADTQVTVSGTKKSKEVVTGQTSLIKTITNFFTKANDETLSPEQKSKEVEKANATSAIVLRMANVMVNRGIYESVDQVYKALDFTSLLSKLNKGSLNKTSDPGLTLKSGDVYTDQNGNERVRGEDSDDDKAFDIYSKFGLDAKAEDIPGATTTANKLSRSEDVILKNETAVEKAKANPLINGEDTEEGYKITGSIDPQSMQWIGIPKETTQSEGITSDNVPESLKPSVSMIEGSQAVIDQATQSPTISTVLKAVSNFYEQQALTEEEKNTLQKEANTSLGKEATPEEVSDFLARGFEQYLKDETAPNNKTLGQTIEVKGQKGTLISIFKQMRQYLVDMYDSIFGSNIDIKLTQPMKQLYQDMLGIGFADRETKRKSLSKETFPKSLVGESFSTELETTDFIKGRNYKILGANSGSTTSVTVKANGETISVPKGQVAVRDSITKEIKVVPISKVISQLPDERTEKVVKKERVECKEKVSLVVDIPEQFEEIDAPLPPQEIISQRITTLEDQIVSKEPLPVPKKPGKVKAPVATVDGLKTFAGPEDTKGGVFLKDGEAVYVLPYFGAYVQVDEDTFKAYNKAVSSKAPTEITKSRSLNNIKVRSTVSLSQNIDDVEQERNYEVIKSGKSEVTVRETSTGQEIDIENVTMKTGEAAMINQQVKQALIDKYIGETFKDINKFLNPNPTTIQGESLPNLPIQC